MNLFSMKELYDVFLKTTCAISIDGIEYEEGETIAKFDKIQMAAVDADTSWVSANGGFDNRARVFWQTTKDVRINFTQGVFSTLFFSLLTNSKKITKPINQNILIHKQEYKESDENGMFTLDETPVDKLYIYNKETGEKLQYTIDNKEVTISNTYLDVVADYGYNYTNGAQIVKIGDACLCGYLSLEGKTRVKDDTSGQTVTGIIKFPRIKLMSDLSIRLGEKAPPVTTGFSAIGIPVGSRGNSYVCEFYFLNNDLDSDF